MLAIGARRWVIADGYLPEWSQGPAPEFSSHEAACILNTGADPANVRLTVFFEERDPVEYTLLVSPRRTLHQRLGDLRDPEPIPTGLGYSYVVEADVPVVVQHTRLDSRQAANALTSTIAYPAREENE
ncbi:MAG TPA: sensory rhodopsin transducer [Solirubrobacteraceae bacterium]